MPCQDNSGAVLIGDVLVVALSDGAGSAKFSEEGSKLIVETAHEFFSDLFNGHPEPEGLLKDLDSSDGKRLLQEIRNKLEAAAAKKTAALNDFASTMLVAVIHHSRSCFYQIGDGIWCARKSGMVGAVTWPQQGEYAGQTDFVTTSTAEASLQFSAIPGKIDFAVGMSDGLERLALDFRYCLPHLGFCEPLIKGLLASDNEVLFKDGLNLFLNSPRVLDRTDDDKTLALVAHVGCL